MDGVRCLVAVLLVDCTVASGVGGALFAATTGSVAAAIDGAGSSGASEGVAAGAEPSTVASASVSIV